MPRKEPAKMSNLELKRIHASSLRLTANVDWAQIREMIRRGFFSKEIWLDELDVLESVAKEIMNERTKKAGPCWRLTRSCGRKQKRLSMSQHGFRPRRDVLGGAARRKSKKSMLS